MPTKAQLEHQLRLKSEQLTVARRNSIEDASLRDLSTELLCRIDSIRCEKQDEMDSAKSEYEQLDAAYEAIDQADDRVREVSE